MKNALFGFVVLCSFSEVFAQSQLHVSLTDHSRFTVAVNGRYFNRRGTSVTVGDLPPGRHSLTIYGTYSDRWGQAHMSTLFQGRIVTEYRMTTNVLYDPDTRNIKVTHNASSGTAAVEDADGMDDYGRQSPAESSTAPANTSGGPAASPAVMGSLSQSEQERLKKKMDNLKTDTDKLKTAKESLDAKTLSVFQVMTIMDWFLFESTKLDFAKWAYGITVDKGSYSDLSGKFESKMYQDDFARFLASRQRR